MKGKNEGVKLTFGPRRGLNPRWGRGWGGIFSPQRETRRGCEQGRGQGMCLPSPTHPVAIPTLYRREGEGWGWKGDRIA